MRHEISLHIAVTDPFKNINVITTVALLLKPGLWLNPERIDCKTKTRSGAKEAP
jgi:hypothetical protein